MKLIEQIRNLKVAYTHGGIFHADDVFSSALLKYINPEIVIKRIFATDDLDPENDLVFDIGLGEFDHHQPNHEKKVRDNFIPYAAFGLLWKELGVHILGEKDAKKFDEDFVQSIDYADNTAYPNIISQLISNFNPSWDEKVSADEKFKEAVDVAFKILQNEFKSIISKNNAFEIVSNVYNNSSLKEIIVLPYYAPWQEALAGTEAKFVIYESLRGGYNLQPVPNTDAKIPKELWGAKEFSETGMTFCHPGGFLASFETVEDAQSAARKFLGGKKYV